MPEGDGGLPALSNANQLKVMQLVKAGMPMDEAVKQATAINKKEQRERVSLSENWTTA